MHKVPGYTINSLIHNGARCAVYRGHPNSDAGLNVILKVFKDADDPARVSRFEHEFMIARSLRGLDNVAQAVEFVHTDACCAIVFSDTGIGSIPLQSMLERKGPFDQKFFLEISIQLCDALYSVHKQWFIHKDLSPANILVDQHSGVVTLIDFGISEECSPTSLLENSHVGKIEGTLEYISPEQTGRTDVMVDFRSDLYSLGATMYHMLTGKVPFADTVHKTSSVSTFPSDQLPSFNSSLTASAIASPSAAPSTPTEHSTRRDYISIIHAHLARIPPDVARNRKDLHPVIPSIVAKLMHKNPRQRYQSARGLKHDLMRCLDDVTNAAAVARASRRQSITTLGFELGAQDIGAILEVNESIRCHHHEKEVLTAALERVSWHASEVMTVTGPSGVGKTTLVAGLQDHARRYGLFAMAKWDQFSPEIPYGTILMCIRSLVTQAQGSLPDFQLWSRSVGILLTGPNAQLLLDAVPEVTPLVPKDHVISKIPSSLPTKEARDRFVQLVTDLIHIFTEQTVLTLCFDDLQWADSASLELLISIATECRHSLFMVWVYRDNELTPEHILTAAIANTKRTIANFSTLPVAPLTEVEVVDLVSTSLRCSHAEAGPLGRLIHSKTQGNLFFALHFFKGLYHKSLLWFNWDTNKWCWNTDHIQWMENTDNVIDFLVASLKRTPPYVIAVLHPAACMGHIFNMEIITRLPSCMKMPPQQIEHALQIALHQGFITHVRVPHETLSRGEPTISETCFKFTHDRVQQAVYNLFSAHATHLEIGRVLLSQAVLQNPDDIFAIEIVNESDLFSAMDHINHSVDVIASSEFDDIERQRICILNLRAGNMAKSAGAHESALKYINCGISLLPSDCWTGTLYPVALDLHLLSAECEYMCNNAEWATAVFETILHFARTDLDKAAAFSLRMAVYTADSHFDEAIESGCRACKLLGWDVDSSMASLLAMQLISEVDRLLTQVSQSASPTSPPPSPVSFISPIPRTQPPSVALGMGEPEQQRLMLKDLDDILDNNMPSSASSLGARWAVPKLAFLPEMTDIKAIELMKVLSVMASFTFMTNPAVFAMCACKMVQITLQHGNCPYSCLGFSYFAFYQGTFENFRTANEFGMTARALSDRYKLDGMVATYGRTLLCHAGWVAKWGQPLATCGPQLVQAYHDLLAAGDVLCATVAALIKVTHDVWVGEPLPTLLAEATKAVELLNKKCPIKSLSHLVTSSVRFAMLMMGLTQSTSSMDDPDPPATKSPKLSQATTEANASYGSDMSEVQVTRFSEASFLEAIRTQTGRMRYSHLCWHSVFRLKGLYLLENYTEAFTVGRECKQLIHHLAGQTHVVLFHFYYALTLVQLIKRAETDVKLRDSYLSEIRESTVVLAKWAESAPFNFAHRYQLVRAEVARISGRMEKAQGLYEQAIMGCRNNGFLHQEALAIELSSQFFFGRGLVAQGAVLLKSSMDKYDQWGATAKVRILKPRYMGFIIPQQAPTSSSQKLLFPPTTHSTQAQKKASPHQMSQLLQPRPLSLSFSSTADSAKIDVVSVVQASQLVSQEMQLDKMLQKFIQIVMENAGADRVVLLLRDGETLSVKAEWDFLKTQHPTIFEDPLLKLGSDETSIEEVSHFVPKHVVETVAKSRMPLMVSDPSHSEYGNDPYFTRMNGSVSNLGASHDGRQPSSILCCPIHRTAFPGVIGVIFLETSSAISVFTNERLMVLELLCSQMAISFENASLYSSIKSSEQRYRLLTEVMPQFVWIADRTGHLQHCNRRMLEYFGASDVSKATNFMTTIHPDEQDGAQLLWEKSLRSGEVFSLDARFRGVDGGYRWFLAKALPLTKEGSTVNLKRVKSEDGSSATPRRSSSSNALDEESFEIEEWFGTLTDVNEQKLVELERAHQRAIESSEKRYRLLAEVIPQIVWTATPNGYIDYLNARFYEYTGIKQSGQEFAEATFSQFVSPPPLASSTVVPMELHPPPARTISNSALVTPGQVTPVSNTSTPLNAPTTSSAANPLSSSGTFEQTSLSPLSNASGGWLDASHPADQERIIAEWAKALAVEDAFEIECRLRNNKGEYSWHLVRALPVSDSEGKLMKWFGTCTNIEEQKRAEQERIYYFIEANISISLTKLDIHAREVAVQTAQIKTAFVANMSHEIRTPLNGILGMVNLILESELNDDQRENAGMIQKCADGLLLIINDVLNFSKLEAGKMELTRINFNLEQVFEGVAEVLIMQASEKGLDLFFMLDPRIPLLSGDPIKLHQILLNLIGNAIKFTDVGEVLTTCKLIESRPLSASRLSIQESTSVPVDEIELLFEVKDSGCGINPEHQKRLFTPFFQADARTTRKYGGTGLGLAICQQLVRMFDGTIRVDSEVGKGSCFSFSVHLKVATNVNPTQPEPFSSYLKALVIANSHNLRLTVSHQLASLNVHADDVMAVPSQLLHMLRVAVNVDHPFNIIVLDHTSWDKVKEVCTAIMSEKQIVARIDALILLLDPVAKRDFSANNTSFSSLPIHIITKPLMRSKLRALLAAIFQGKSPLIRSTSLNNSSQNILQLPPSSYASRSLSPSSPSTTIPPDALPTPPAALLSSSPSSLSSSPSSLSSSSSSSLSATEPHPRTDLRVNHVPSLSTPNMGEEERVYNVMLAEDNAINTKVLIKYLKQMSLNIHAVTNGIEAVELFSSMPLGYFSLILMDCHMPLMDGFQATEEIRRIEMGQTHVPIVSLTANVMPGIVEQCVQAGMDYYLSKPVNFSQLKDIIRGIILQN